MEHTNDFLKPERIIDSWDVRPGEIIADFGCGAGYFSVLLGKRVGPKGRIYAIDIREAALFSTRLRTKLFGLMNIEMIRGDLEVPKGSRMKDESVSKVLITNILFQVDDVEAVVCETFRILKPGGSAVVIEWALRNETWIPVLPNTIESREIKRIFEKHKLMFFKEIYAGSHHYGLEFRKQL